MINNDVLRQAGSVVACADGTLSHAGGFRGACSHHGGVAGRSVKAAATSAPAIASRAHATVVRVRPPAPSIRNPWILMGLSGLTGAALVAASELKSRRAQQQPECGGGRRPHPPSC